MPVNNASKHAVSGQCKQTYPLQSINRVYYLLKLTPGYYYLPLMIKLLYIGPFNLSMNLTAALRPSWTTFSDTHLCMSIAS